MRFSFLNHDFVAFDDRRELRPKSKSKNGNWKVEGVVSRFGGVIRKRGGLEMKKITISSLIAKYCFVRIVLYIWINSALCKYREQSNKL